MGNAVRNRVAFRKLQLDRVELKYIPAGNNAPGGMGFNWTGWN